MSSTSQPYCSSHLKGRTCADRREHTTVTYCHQPSEAVWPPALTSVCSSSESKYAPEVAKHGSRRWRISALLVNGLGLYCDVVGPKDCSSPSSVHPPGAVRVSNRCTAGIGPRRANGSCESETTRSSPSESRDSLPGGNRAGGLLSNGCRHEELASTARFRMGSRIPRGRVRQWAQLCELAEQAAYLTPLSARAYTDHRQTTQ